MTKTRFATLVLPIAALLAAGQAIAAPADEARAHFQAIAAGDLPALMQGYAEGARFEWVGGPLDGSYAGSEAIRAVWSKFAAAQGGPLKLAVDKLEESANPKGATVSAHVLFEGKAAIKVRYVLTLREGKIVSEIWQIDPKLNLAAAY
ncbi:nuclear transport factor 2 family protein [Roseateles violae]|uniref:Nuclear transport factor 2 family protein n=1 Tax=Roseateles violae TaxID=3058042 RepID=A0ABT8DWG3_9BURK|nr:nuclear transport factor 2 family protein [Pelomonas sp. PFR6]MDN3921373.1 nuclear transport factor 2 family protein [Pelomonas sp. PFR6]